MTIPSVMEEMTCCVSRLLALPHRLGWLSSRAGHLAWLKCRPLTRFGWTELDETLSVQSRHLNPLDPLRQRPTPGVGCEFWRLPARCWHSLIRHEDHKASDQRRRRRLQQSRPVRRWRLDWKSMPSLKSMSSIMGRVRRLSGGGVCGKGSVSLEHCASEWS